MKAVLRFARGVGIASAMATAVPVAGLAVISVGTGPAFAQAVSQIVVQGNRRIEDATVRSYLAIRPGQAATPQAIDESLKTLFATGLFSDVRINQQGGRLVVTVVENPIIQRITFEGNRRIRDAALQSEIESRAGSGLTRARVQSDVQRIIELYRRQGRFEANIDPQTIERADGRVDLVFVINEGDRTGVASINFVGNTEYGDGTLRGVINTTRTNILSFLRRSDVYDPDRLQADQEALRRFYLSNGYADFRVISADATFNEQRNGFDITFQVEEGQRYRYGQVDVESNILDVDTESLRRHVGPSSGSIYNAEEVEETLEALSVEVSRSGYAFAQVTPRGFRNPETGTIDLTFVVDEGPRVYVERIEIRGNTRTQDAVIRREFDLAEGDAYNRVLIDRAERRLNALRYFSRVQVSNQPGSAPDRVVVNVLVEEEATGNISLGGGYSSSDGFIADVGISERNFLGRGQQVRFAVGYGERRQSVDFSFTEPYFMGRRLAFGIDAFARKQDLENVSSYNFRLYGGGLRLGLPITDNLGVQLRYRLQNFEVTDIANDFFLEPDSNTFISARDIIEFNPDGGTVFLPSNAQGPFPGASAVVQQYEGQSFLSSQVGYSIIYDRRDNRVDPRNGYYFNFSQDFAGVGGDTQFIRTSGEGRGYYEIWPDWVASATIEAGHIIGLGGDDVRIFDNFFKGGETVRGFATAGFGPRDLTPGRREDALGGTTYAAASAELQFPFPVLPKDLGFRAAVFADAGTLFDFRDEPDVAPIGYAGEFPLTIADDASIRSSVGASILWNSPFGPLRADFGYAVTKEDYDNTQFFRFGGGTSF